jgi:hypothetical protein
VWFTIANSGDGTVNLVGTVCTWQGKVCHSFAGDYRGTLQGRHLRVPKSPVGLMDLTAVVDPNRNLAGEPAAGCHQLYGEWFSMHGYSDQATPVAWTGQFGGIAVQRDHANHASSSQPWCDFEIDGVVTWAFTPLPG